MGCTDVQKLSMQIVCNTTNYECTWMQNCCCSSIYLCSPDSASGSVIVASMRKSLKAHASSVVCGLVKGCLCGYHCLQAGMYRGGGESRKVILGLRRCVKVLRSTQLACNPVPSVESGCDELGWACESLGSEVEKWQLVDRCW